MEFDPTQLGAVPVETFDPTSLGAVPVADNFDPASLGAVPMDASAVAAFKAAQPAFAASTSYLNATGIASALQAQKVQQASESAQIMQDVTTGPGGYLGAVARTPALPTAPEQPTVHSVADIVRKRLDLNSENMQTPIVGLPKPENRGVVSGTIRGVETLGEGLETPENIALLASIEGAPIAVKTIASAAFRALMVKTGAEAVASTINEPGTPGERAENLTIALGSFGLASMPEGRLREPAELPAASKDASAAIVSQAPTDALQAASEDPKLTAHLHPEIRAKINEELAGRLSSEIEPALPRLPGDTQDKVREIIAKQASGEPLSQNEQATMIQVRSLASKVKGDQTNAEFTAPTSQPQGTTPPPTPEAAGETTGSPPAQGGRSSLFSQALAEQAPAAELDALHLERQRLADPFNHEPGWQEKLDRIDAILDSHDQTAVAESAHRTSQNLTPETAKALEETPTEETVARQSPLDQLKALQSDAEPIDASAEKMANDLQKLGRVNRDSTKAVAQELKYYSDAERQQLQQHLKTDDAEPDTLAKAITGRDVLKEKTTVSEYLDEPAGKEGRGHPTADVAKEAFGEDYTGGPGAMGPREAAAMAAEQPTTGLKKATVMVERLSRGEEPLPAAERQSETDAVQRAIENNDLNPMAARDLVARILDKGDTAISRDEAASLLVERNRVTEEMRQADARINNPDASPLEVSEAREQMKDLETQIDRLDRAQKEAGSQWGSVGHMYQRMIREDYSLEGIQRKMRSAKGGPLTEEERMQSAKLAEDSQKAIEARDKADAARAADQEKDDLKYFYEQTIKEMTKEAAKAPKVSKPVLDIAQKIVDRWKSEADVARKSLRERLGRTSAGIDPTIVMDVAKIMRAHVGEIGLNLAKVTARLHEDFGDAVKPYIKDAWKKTQELIGKESATPAVRDAVKKGIGAKDKTPVQVSAKAKSEATAGEPLSNQTVYDLTRAHIKAGVHGEDAVMAAVHKDIKEAYPAATERDVRRAFSDYGKTKFPSQEAVAKELRELRTLTRLQESIDRLNEGKDALKTGPQRDKATQDIREKQKQLNELLKTRQGPPSPEKLASQETSKITALENRISDLDKELRTGERPPGSNPFPDSPKVEQLKAERDAMQEKLNEVRDSQKPQKTDAEIERDNAQKGVDAASAALDRWDRILKGELEPETKTPREPLSNLEEEIRSQVDAMKKAAADIRNAERPRTGTEEAKLKALEKSVAEYERRVNENDFSSKPKKEGPDTKEIAAAKAARDAAKEAYEALKEAQKPKPTPEESYNKRRMTDIAKRQADLEDRLKTGNFDKQKPVPLKKTAEVAAAEAKLTETRREVEKAIEKKKFDQLSPQQKLIKEAVSTFRSITAIKILGHGAVGMVTHAGGLIFRPSRATIYWKNFGRQFAMWHNKSLHEQLIYRLKNDPEFETWKKAGASIDPEKTYTDYGMYAQWLGKLGEKGARGFDALKLVRMELNKADWKSVPDDIKSDPQQSDAARKLIAEINNKATGTSPKTNPMGKTLEEGFYGLSKNPVLEAAFFAPRLYASRWGRVLFDPVNTARTLIDPQSSPVERFAANKKLKNAAEFTAVLAGALLTNQAILSATGSSQNVNLTDPKKSDWLKFKAGGKTVMVDGGLLDPVRLVGQVVFKDLLADRTKSEQYREGTRFKMAVDTVGNYLRGKLNPPVGLAADVATGADFQGRPLPWSKDKPQYKDQQPYTMGEWLISQGPIPMAGAAKDVSDELKKRGFKDNEVNVILKGAMMFGLGMAGVHVGEDHSIEQKPAHAKKKK